MNARSLAISLAVFTAFGPVLAAPDPGASKRAFAIEDFYRLSPVGAPALSPDGKTVVYGLTTNDLPKAKRTVHLWRVDPDGKNGRQITFADGRDENPAFSPDGKWIGFVSTRGNDPQLYVLPVDGGEAVQKSHVPGGIGAFLFSPDGKHVAVTADVAPECRADKDCNQKLIGAKESGKMKAHVADSLLYRHWTDWKDGTRTHILVSELAGERSRGGTSRRATSTRPSSRWAARSTSPSPPTARSSRSPRTGRATKPPPRTPISSPCGSTGRTRISRARGT
ncbi:MAG TPA: hypothetical protein VGR00_11660 [Thermoanaerobaculia bacterium]|nr:hypothetical protein [Thermoanaerobaculia bacterium]